VRELGGLDVLVNIAGRHQMRRTESMTDDDWAQDLAVNLNGPFYLCRAALPHLLERGGNIINVSSIAGVEGQAYSAGYCAAKHGLLGLTRALAVEYTSDRLRVNAICPRRMMHPVDVANVIAFLASDAAAAIHGAVYRVDNGKGAGAEVPACRAEHDRPRVVVGIELLEGIGESGDEAGVEVVSSAALELDGGHVVGGHLDADLMVHGLFISVR
jgi:NAD(P)-dependent dehydrogenase (short-subunit alcohol dehydrogenase family)